MIPSPVPEANEAALAELLAHALVQRMTWPSMHWKTQSLDMEAAHALAKTSISELRKAGWLPPETVTEREAAAVRAVIDLALTNVHIIESAAKVIGANAGVTDWELIPLDDILAYRSTARAVLSTLHAVAALARADSLAPEAPSEAGLPRLLNVPSEEAMYELLHALNVSGHRPEVPCVAFGDAGGPGGPNPWASPFLATLTEPDASYVNYIAADESGRSQCVVGCENCGSDGHEDERQPTYPVTVVLAIEPDADRCHDDEIDTWWLAPSEAQA